MTGSPEVTTWRPAVALFLCAPLFGEVLGAALRPSNVTQPLRVIAIVTFYGAGALLIREVAQRRRLGWAGIVALGLAYSLVEEGLVLWTMFAPDGMMGGEQLFGYALGVNWLWAVTVCGYHVVWSIVVPIALVRSAFPTVRDSPWLGQAGIRVTVSMFACGTALLVFLSLHRSDFRPHPGQFAAALVVASALIWWAVHRTTAPHADAPVRVPRRSVAVLTAMGLGLLWLALYVVALTDGGVSFVWWTAAAVGFAAAVTAIAWRRRGAVARRVPELCLGAGLAAALFGVLLAYGEDQQLDRIVYPGLLPALVVGYAVVRRRGDRAAPG